MEKEAMEEKDVLEKLRLWGLDTVATESDGGVSIETEPSYRGNYGFHSLIFPDGKAIILKGVYKDFLRIVEGSADIHETDWNELAKTLNNAETAAGGAIYLKIKLLAGTCHILSARTKELPPISLKDKRDYKIPRPLTSVEYALPTSKLYDESVTLSAGFFAEFFPPLISPLTESAFSKLPDILNPVFVSCNLKTSSPTAVPVYARPYINMTALEKVLKTIDASVPLFRASFAPHLYIKQKKEKISRLNKNYFPVTTEEIEELLTELKSSTAHIDRNNIAEDSFLEYPAQFSIIYEYLALELTDGLASLLRYIPSIREALEAIFKTRKNSLFYGEKTLELPEFFDFSSEKVPVNFNVKIPDETPETYIKRLSFFKKLGAKSKILQNLEKIHKLLDLRDAAYLAAASFIIKSREVFLDLADFGVKKERLKKTADIFLFEHEEVRRISFDSFYGDSFHTILFRSWQLERYGAQAIPPEIYGSDLENCPQISEQMIKKALELVEFSALPLSGKGMEGKVVTDLDMDNYNGLILTSRSLSIPLLPRYGSAAGFILENAALFGLTAEYAIINDIPLYTGVRFAPLVLKNCEIKAEGDKISKTALPR